MSDDKIYSIIIEGKECGFFLERREDGKIFLIIPDCGGMADAVPRHAEQLAWLEPRMDKIQGASHIWPTVWDLETPGAVTSVEVLLRQYGTLSKKQRVDFF